MEVQTFYVRHLLQVKFHQIIVMDQKKIYQLSAWILLI